MNTNAILNNVPAAATEFDTALAALIESTNKKLDDANEMRDLQRQERREALFNDTILAMVLGSRRHLGIAMWKLNETPTAPTVKATPKFSNKIAVIAGITLVLDQAMKENDRKRITIYCQDSEVSRVAGMISRARAGNDEFLTQKEAEFVMRFRDMGEDYIKYCKALFGRVKKALDAGFAIKMVSIDHINCTPLRNKRLPLELAGRMVKFTNGTARIQNHVLTMDRMSLSGNFELAVVNGALAVKRDVNAPDAKEKMPEAYYASNMLKIVSGSITVAATEASVSSDGDDEETAAA